MHSGGPYRPQRIYAATAFRITPPEALVPARHFEGTSLASNRFAFYGECFTLTTPIDREANPDTSHWGHDLNRLGLLILYERDQTPQSTVSMLNLIRDWIDANGAELRRSSPYAWENLLNIAIRMENWWQCGD